MPRLLLTLSLCILAIPTAAQTPPTDALPELTLSQAIAEAQENNRLIKMSDQGVLYSNDAILAAQTQRYPQFNVQLIGSYLPTAINIHIPQGAFGNVGETPVPNDNSVLVTNPKFSGLSLVQVYQPLSKLYDAHLNIELLKVGKRLSEEQLRQQRQQVNTSVKEAYYSLLQTQSALDAAEENVKALHEVDRTTEQFLKEKTVLQYQSTGVKAQLAQAELQLVTLQDTLQTQKENLNNLLGRDVRTDFRVSGVPGPLPEEQDLESARRIALENRTEVRQAQFKIDQAVFSRRLQKAQYIPEIGGQYMYFSPFTIQGFPENVNSIGLSLKWDVFDWGYKRHLLDEKDRTIAQSRLNLTETQSQVVLDIDNRFRKLREARAQLKVSELSQEAEKEKLDAVLEQYKQKAALLSSVQTEESNMAQTAAQYQQALANFWTARSEFEKSLGED
ncbi:MAG TPA: TolC family protein [Candidatus Eisenbacteria bacterium]|nr:TolC family protein [Candidatus Eisenbacteria bacterium]